MDILGIGECMIELDASQSLETATTFTRQVGGDVYNTLVAASRLGSRTGFFTRVAMDGFGQVLMNHFAENDIDTRHVLKTQDGKNGLYLASRDGMGSHSFLYYRQNSAASQIHPNQFTPDMLKGVSILYATGISQAISDTARKTVLKAFQLAKQMDIVVAYDTNYRPTLWKHRDIAIEAMVEVLPYVDVLLPSDRDLMQLFDIKDIPHMIEYIFLRDVPIFALKLGDQGVTLGFRRKTEVIPAHPVPDMKDTIGAGDAFNGGFLHGLLQHRSLIECAQIGSVVAAHSIREFGPILGLPGWNRVQDALRVQQPTVHEFNPVGV